MASQKYAEWKHNLEAGSPYPLDGSSTIHTAYHLEVRCVSCTGNMTKSVTPVRVVSVGGKKKLSKKSVHYVCDHCGHKEKALNEREKRIQEGDFDD